MKAYERFLNYIAYDTQSDGTAPRSQIPSTPKQKILGNYLAEEMRSLGIHKAGMDEYGYVYGRIAASPGCEKLPPLALLSHMDTAMDMSGANIKARIIHKYSGGDIRLSSAEVPPEQAVYTLVSQYPVLKKYIGHDLIVTDGTTLLGADNKAGIAEILTLAEFLYDNPHFPHPPISICFTPDEEIGRSADHINLQVLDASYGYTVDGGAVGDIQYENFNAAAASVRIHGITAHTGYAKGILKNSALIAVELQNMLPACQSPACTEGREGFFHLNSIEGCAEHTLMEYLIRDHNLENFEKRKEFLAAAVRFLNTKYGANTVELAITDTYFNMANKILPYPELISLAQKAIRLAGAIPVSEPIRGGTDGSRLSYMGLPCPNLCTGGQLGHGRHEFISIQSMDTVVEILKHLVHLFAENSPTVS